MKKSQLKIQKIGIDARFFGPQDKGFGRYTEQLIKNLENLDNHNQYFIFLRKERWDDYNPKNPNFKKVLADYKWYGIKEQILLPLKIKKYKIDLMHFTHFNVPIFFRNKFIVTIHDLTLRRFPTHKRSIKNLIIYPIKNLAYRIIFRHSIKNSEKIIAISDYTKQEIINYYKVNPNKIKVIYEGAPNQNSKSHAYRQAGKIQNSKFSKRKYLLYVGNAYPHKNLKRLILAFEKIKKDFSDLYLVLIGGDDYFYKKLKKFIHNSKFIIRDYVLFPGFIPDKDLNTVYQYATLYVFPSLAEGFGLPSLEAMTRGVPVASSDATCLPEILGDAAIYFNPLSIDDMAKKIKKALINENLRKNLIDKGFKQIKTYSWQNMAKETLKIYKKIIKKKTKRINIQE